MVTSNRRGKSAPSTPSPPFGELLKQYRRAAGLTQEMLAERAGYSTVYVSMLERGRRQPFHATIEALADALELAPVERAALQMAGRSGPETPSPIVGRELEVNLLERHVIGEGRPVFLLAGEPGIGKSCLLGEASARAALRGMTVLAGGCTRRGGEEPYAPLLDAVQRYIRTRSPDDLRGDLAGCAWLVRLLPELADGPIDPLPAWTLTPAQEQRLMTAALIRFLTNIAGPTGTLLVLDDLHWAGADALDLLAVLARSADEVPLRVIGAYRDTEIHPEHPLSTVLADLAQSGMVTQVDLKPLDLEHARELLNRRLGRQDTDEATREKTLQRAGGVPFFVISCAQALDTGGAIDADHIPWDLAQSVRQRIATLPEEARDVLSVAAVIGRRVDAQLVVGAVDRPEDGTLRSLETSRRARLLEEDGAAYLFPHDVIREVAERDLGPARRALIHRRVAEAIEARRGEKPVELLAYHYARSGTTEQAITYLELAGDSARARYANSAAEGYYRELIDVLDSHGDESARARVREKLGDVLARAGQYRRALDALEAAARIYLTRDDMSGLRRTAAQIGRVHAQRDSTAEGLRYLQPYVDALPADHRSDEAVEMFNAMARLHFVSGQYEEQRAIAERAVEMAQQLDNERLLTTAESMLAAALGMVGRIDESLEIGERAVERAERLRDLDTIRRASNNIGATYLEGGDLERSRPYVERAASAARQGGDPTLIGFSLATLAELNFLSGNWEEARRECEEALAIGRTVDSSSLAGLAVLNIGQIEVARGNWEEAVAYLEDLLAHTREFQTRRCAHRYLGLHDIHQGRPADALRRLEPLLDRPGMIEWDAIRLRPVMALACLALGEPGRAAAIAEDAVQRARDAGYGLALLEAIRAHALALIELERWAQAEGLLAEGLERARAMPHPYEEARMLEAQGRLAAQRGDSMTAGACFAAALGIFARLGACLAEERTRAALGLPRDAGASPPGAGE
jgi:tetratricopeptide (TPR) repeat protein/transcriptional regulator with XRE-family HTH domain